MAESEDQGSAPEAAPEPFKKRDEKGLTLSGRLVLRMLMEHIRIQDSASRLGGDTSVFSTLKQITLVDEVENLIFFARQMAAKIGDEDTVNLYLLEHQEADEKALHELRAEHEKNHPSRPTFGVGVVGIPHPGTCEKCGGPLCPGCGGCHREHKEQPLN